jgi:hypothetical protein
VTLASYVKYIAGEKISDTVVPTHIGPNILTRLVIVDAQVMD